MNQGIVVKRRKCSREVKRILQKLLFFKFNIYIIWNEIIIRLDNFVELYDINRALSFIFNEFGVTFQAHDPFVIHIGLTYHRTH